MPEGWLRRPLASEVVGLDAGVSVNAEDRPHGLGEIGVLKTSALSGGAFQASENKTVLSAERSRVRVRVRADSVLVSRMNTPELVGEAAFVPSDFPDLYLPDRIWQLRLRDTEACAVRWLGHYLRCPLARAHIAQSASGTSGSMKNLPKERFLAMLVNWPPLPEQRQIAAILDTIDDAILKTEQIIAKLKQVKQGLLHDLLTRGIDDNGELRDPERHPEQFKDSELGRIPSTWTASRIGELGELITGRTPPSSDPGAWGDELPFVTPVEVPNDGTVSPTERRLSSSGLRYVRRLPAGSVLVVCIGSTIGKVGLTRWPCATNQQVNAIVCSDLNRPGFIAAAVGFHIGQLHQVAGLQAVPIVNKTQFSRMFVATAPASEQVVVSDRLAALDSCVEDEEVHVDKLRLLKTGLMEDLLTGRVRVTSLLESA